MGPVFSLFLALLGGAVLAGVAYCVLRFLYSAGRALIMAVAFVAGAGAGTVAAGLVAIPIVGVGGTLASGAAMAYLAWLAAGSVAGGVGAVIGAARFLAWREGAPEAL